MQFARRLSAVVVTTAAAVLAAPMAFGAPVVPATATVPHAGEVEPATNTPLYVPEPATTVGDPSTPDPADAPADAGAAAAGRRGAACRSPGAAAALAQSSRPRSPMVVVATCSGRLTTSAQRARGRPAPVPASQSRSLIPVSTHRTAIWLAGSSPAMTRFANVPSTKPRTRMVTGLTLPAQSSPTARCRASHRTRGSCRCESWIPRATAQPPTSFAARSGQPTTALR